MALYVAICLMASLIAIPEIAAEHTNVMGLIWGVTLGLALAHWFAFRVSARMVGPARSALPMSNWLVPSCSARPASQWWSPLVCSSCPTPGIRGRRVPPRRLDLPDRVRRSSGRWRVPPAGRGLLALRACVRGHHCRPEEPAGRALTDPPDRWGRSEGQPCHTRKARTFEGVGVAAAIDADQRPPLQRRGQRRKRGVHRGDQVRGVVGVGVTAAQQPGQRLPGAALIVIKERQHRMMPEGLLERRCGQFLLRVRDHDRRSMFTATCPSGRGPPPAACTRSRDVACAAAIAVSTSAPPAARSAMTRDTVGSLGTGPTTAAASRSMPMSARQSPPSATV